MLHTFISLFFFFNDTATTEIYTLSLHDALPISGSDEENILNLALQRPNLLLCLVHRDTLPEKAVGCQSICDHIAQIRSEEHTSELQSHLNLVCRLLLEKKKNKCLYDIYQ